MTSTVFYTAMTLDGYLADEHDSLDWLFVQEQDEHGPLNYDEFYAGIGALAMGATTYQWVVDHLARSDEGWPYAKPSWVFTHRDLAPPEGADVRFVQGAVADVWDDLAAAAGDQAVWVVGGGDLAAQFAAAGHLDELIVYVAPVVLGAGRPLFTRPWDLRLEELHRNGAFVAARYAVLGARATAGPGS